METKRYHITKSGDVEVEFADSDLLEEYDALAREALSECRATIMMAARFLNPALWRLPLERSPMRRALAVGGRVMRYDPEAVVGRYRASQAELVRDCLHAMLHCIFQHPFDRRHHEFDTWSLACDIAVEACAMDLCAQRFACAEDGKRAEELAKLRSFARNLTAPALYRVLRHGGPGELLHDSQGLSGADIERLRELFTRDGHELWAGRPHTMEQDERPRQSAGIPDMQAQGQGMRQEAERLDGGAAEDARSDGAARRDDAAARSETQVPDDDDAPEDAPGPGDVPSRDDPSEPEEAPDLEDSSLREGDPPSADESDAQETERLSEEWQKVAKQVQAELRAQCRRGTTGKGDMLVNLSVANKEAANYDEFLRRFATVAEDLRVNDDEFDYIFYTYGLARYGNVPLVEPLEYAESNRVREFVIAIDTSGSCSGRLVHEFVARTYSILRQRTSFGDDINVHIVQCDKEIRTATKVTSLHQLEEYRDSFWVSGGGGTDFRPVFDYVDSLVESGEFNDLRGLVYFTDGYGAFPTRAPAYDAAFVFVDVEGMEVRVPPWAMKVVMTQDEIMGCD